MNTNCDLPRYALAFGDGDSFASEVLVKAQQLAVAQLKMAAVLRSTWSCWLNFITTSLRPSPGNHGLFMFI